MKIKEFKRAINNTGLQYGINLEVEEDNLAFYIVSGDKTYASIHETTCCLIDTNYSSFALLKEDIKEDLLKIIYQFAKTPVDERQEEKRYIIPLPNLTTSYGEQLFLTHQGNFFPCKRDTRLRQTWKEEDLIYIPEEYRDFAVEIVEVEEWRQ